MSEETEQNKTEEATPYKLQLARRKGQAARGADLGFFAAIAAFALAAATAAPSALVDFVRATSRTLASLEDGADPAELARHASERLLPTITPVFALAGLVAGVVLLFEIMQLRGLVFSFTPLRPDFGRLNPAMGLKRVFSARLFKETLKSVAKFVAYASAAAALAWDTALKQAFVSSNALALSGTLWSTSSQLVFVFVLIAFTFMLVDQVLARGEFAKRMRMSRRELLREHREREGDPRLKQKRRQLHAEFARRMQGFGELGGADLLIVNPDHYAVALRYDAAVMTAPRLVVKGRDHLAVALKQRAAQISLPIFQHPPLARDLFQSCETGAETPPRLYRDIAGLYLRLRTPNGRVHGAA